MSSQGAKVKYKNTVCDVSFTVPEETSCQGFRSPGFEIIFSRGALYPHHVCVECEILCKHTPTVPDFRGLVRQTTGSRWTCPLNTGAVWEFGTMFWDRSSRQILWSNLALPLTVSLFETSVSDRLQLPSWLQSCGWVRRDWEGGHEHMNTGTFTSVVLIPL